MSATQLSRDEAVVTLLRHFFRLFVEDEEIETGKQGFVSPSYFLSWLDARFGNYVSDCETICEKSGVTGEHWDYFLEMLARTPDGSQDLAVDRLRCLTAATERLWKVWPVIALGDRPLPAHALAAAQFGVLLKYADGTITAISMACLKEMVAAGHFADATVAMVLRNQVEAILDMIGQLGLDGLYERGEPFGGDHPYEVMMGTLLKGKDQVQPEIASYYEKYLRLTQLLLRPPIPPHARAIIEARKREAQARLGGPVEGGWDA